VCGVTAGAVDAAFKLKAAYCAHGAQDLAGNVVKRTSIFEFFCRAVE